MDLVLPFNGQNSRVFFSKTAIRNIASLNENKIYLTFDDGPVASTAAILDLLKLQSVHATFFIVTKKGRDTFDITNRFKIEGHAVGNHSLDHAYAPFFKGSTAIKSWIQEAELYFKDDLNMESVGFRPPAGVCTPHLIKALKELNLPLVLWRRRFYDTAFQWTSEKALSSINNVSGGDIVLLHDRQPPQRLPIYLRALEDYIKMGKKRGFEFCPLTRKLCVQNGRLQK